MKLFHLFAVFPHGISDGGFNQVRLYDFHILAETAQLATREILDSYIAIEPAERLPDVGGTHLVSNAAEIWAHEFCMNADDHRFNPRVLNPGTKHNQVIKLHDHNHWVACQRRWLKLTGEQSYVQVHAGAQSLQEHFDGCANRCIEALRREREMLAA